MEVGKQRERKTKRDGGRAGEREIGGRKTKGGRGKKWVGREKVRSRGKR